MCYTPSWLDEVSGKTNSDLLFSGCRSALWILVREVYVYSTESKYPGKDNSACIKRCSAAAYRHSAFFVRTAAKSSNWQKKDPFYQAIIQGLYTRSIKSADPGKIRVSLFANTMLAMLHFLVHVASIYWRSIARHRGCMDTKPADSMLEFSCKSAGIVFPRFQKLMSMPESKCNACAKLVLLCYFQLAKPSWPECVCINLLVERTLCRAHKHVQEHIKYITSGAPGLPASRLDYLHDFTMRKPFRDLQFTRYVGQQQAINRMVKSLAGQHGARTLIGFGDMGNRDPSGLIKGCPAGPVKKLLRALSKVCTVVMVDEFRTSKLCAECAGEMKGMMGIVKPKRRRQQNRDGSGLQAVADQERGTNFVATGQPSLRSVYSVRVCQDCNAHVNRDVNAARNMCAMLLASLKGERPLRFCRGYSLDNG